MKAPFVEKAVLMSLGFCNSSSYPYSIFYMANDCPYHIAAVYEGEEMLTNEEAVFKPGCVLLRISNIANSQGAVVVVDNLVSLYETLIKYNVTPAIKALRKHKVTNFLKEERASVYVYEFDAIFAEEASS